MNPFNNVAKELALEIKWRIFGGKLSQNKVNELAKIIFRTASNSFKYGIKLGRELNNEELEKFWNSKGNRSEIIKSQTY